jgi:hypothetical protein
MGHRGPGVLKWVWGWGSAIADFAGSGSDATTLCINSDVFPHLQR